MDIQKMSLETSGTSEKITQDTAKSKLEEAVNLQARIQKIAETKNQNITQRLKNTNLEREVRQFLENAANGQLKDDLSTFNAKNFDKNWEVGLDKFEFERFYESVSAAVDAIIVLDGTGKFAEIHQEARDTWGIFNADKWLASKVNMSELINQLGWGKSFTENGLEALGIGEQALHAMSEKPFQITSLQSWNELRLLLMKEFGNGVEDILKFFGNIPAGIIMMPRYLSYRAESLSSDLSDATESEIKLAELTKQHPSLWLLDLLWSKWVTMIKELANKLASGKQWDIATMIIMIAGLVAGGAGLARLWIRAARKQAVTTSKELWMQWRKALPVEQTTRTALKVADQKVTKVQQMASKADDLISGTRLISTVGKGILATRASYTTGEHVATHRTATAESNRASSEPSKPHQTPAEQAQRSAEVLEILSTNDITKLKEALSSVGQLDKVVLTKLIENGLDFLVTDFAKFGLKPDLSTARFILKQKNGLYTLNNNLKKFTGLDESIATMLLDKNLPMLKDSLASFSNLSSPFAQKISEKWGLSPVLENTKSFEASVGKNWDIYKLWAQQNLDPQLVERYFWVTTNHGSLADIQNIPKSGRKSAVANMRSQIATQEHKMAQIVAETRELLENNPQITQEQLLASILKNPTDFSHAQRYEIISRTLAAKQKTADITKYMDQYANNPRGFLEAANPFSADVSKMTGSIHVERQGTSVVFYFDEPADFFRAWGQDYSLLNDYDKTNKWRKLEGSKIPELSDSITFINGGPTNKEIRNTQIHETAHTEFPLLTPREKQLTSNVKDEIVAYLSDPTTTRKQLLDQLTLETGGYNYLEELKSSNPQQYKIKWEKHVKKTNELIDNAIILRELHPTNYRELLAVTSAEKWGRHISTDIILQHEVHRIESTCRSLFESIKKRPEHTEVILQRVQNMLQNPKLDSYAAELLEVRNPAMLQEVSARLPTESQRIFQEFSQAVHSLQVR